jgi:signal transduction histidine kinase
VSDGGEDPGQRVLLDIAQQLAATRDLSALVPLVLERVVALLNAERAMFVLLDLDGQVDRAVTHNLPWPGPPAPLPIARSILDRVVREGKMLVASTLDDSAMGSTESMRRFGLRRVVAVPVLRGSVVLGVIYVDSTGRADGVHEQAETLRALASLVGVSVENARLFDELRYRRDLLAWMVHDLRNPITAVSLNAALLLERAEGEDRVMLAEVESAAERSARMIDWALTLDRIEDSTPAYAPWSMSLRALLARSVQEHASLARQRGVTVALDVPEGMPEVEVYLDRFSVVLDNLLFNALKFAAAGSEVVVRARRRDDSGPSASHRPHRAPRDEGLRPRAPGRARGRRGLRRGVGAERGPARVERRAATAVLPRRAGPAPARAAPPAGSASPSRTTARAASAACSGSRRSRAPRRPCSRSPCPRGREGAARCPLRPHPALVRHPRREV